MSNNVTKILFRRGPDSQRQTVVLQQGEPGYSLDTKRLFIGDGLTFGGTPASIVNYGIVPTLSGSYVYPIGSIKTNLTSSAFVKLSTANVGDIVYDAVTTSLYSISSTTTIGTAPNTTHVVSLSDFAHYFISTKINTNQFLYDNLSNLNVKDAGIGINQLDSTITATSQTLSGGSGNVLGLKTKSVANNYLVSGPTNSVKITNAVGTGTIADITIGGSNQFLGKTGTPGSALGAVNLISTGSTTLSSNLNGISINSPNVSNYLALSGGTLTGGISALGANNGRLVTDVVPVNPSDVVNLNYIYGFTCITPSYLFNSFLTLSGGTMTGRLYGTAFRATQGVPNNIDTSTNGYAFDADGDTGLFSPIVGGGAGNGIVSLYANNIEVLRGYNSSNKPYVSIGTTNPTGTFTTVGPGQGFPAQGPANLTTAGYLDGAIVVGDTGVGVGNGGAIYFAANGTAWNFAAIKGYATNGSNNSQGDITFSTRNNATDSTLTEAMRILSNGNVGINIRNPQAPLHVDGGTLGITAGNTLEIARFTDNNANGNILKISQNRLANGNDWTTAETRLQIITDTTSQGYISFNPDSKGGLSLGVGSPGTEALRVDGTTQFVGINTTGTPAYQLDVTGNTRASRVYADLTPTATNELTRKDYVDTQVYNATPPGCIAYFASKTAPAGWLKANGAVLPRSGVYANLYNAVGTTWGTNDGPSNFRLPDLRGQFIRGWNDGIAQNMGTSTQAAVIPTTDAGRVFGNIQNDSFESHSHGVNDAGHTHTINGNGTGITITDTGHNHTAADSGHTHGYSRLPIPDSNGSFAAYKSNGWYKSNPSNSEAATTGSGKANITVDSKTTGITINDPGHGHVATFSTTGITTSVTGDTENRPTNMALLACIKY